MPAVVAGGPTESGMLPAVWHDERSGTVELVRYLAALGHTRVARVAGEPAFVHSVARTAAFEEATRELELSAQRRSRPTTRPRAEPARHASCCSDPEPPTAIAFDSDVLAVTGLGVAQQMGFSVPDDVSIVAWDDSLLCQVVHPPLTTMSRDVTDYGALACKRLLAMIEDPSLDRGRRGAACGAAPAREHGPRPAACAALGRQARR